MGIAWEAWVIEAQCDMCGTAKVELHGDSRNEAIQSGLAKGWNILGSVKPLVVCPGCKDHPEIKTE